MILSIDKVYSRLDPIRFGGCLVDMIYVSKQSKHLKSDGASRYYEVHLHIVELGEWSKVQRIRSEEVARLIWGC